MGSFSTEFKVLPAGQDLAAVETDVLIIPVYQKQQPEKDSDDKKDATDEKAVNLADWFDWSTELAGLDRAFGGSLKPRLEAEKFKAVNGKRIVSFARSTDDVKARWVILVGLGTTEKLTLAKAQKAFTLAIKDGFAFDKAETVSVQLPEAAAKVSSVQALQAVVFGAIQSTYKTAEAGVDKLQKLKTVQLIAGFEPVEESDVTAARIMAMAEALAKDLANMPANLKRAETLAEAARELTSLEGISVEVIDDNDTIQKTMPCFWAVAQGAAEVDPPRFITIRYVPKGPVKKTIALVGKGVIFDTGGVQVKPGNSMNDMKFDMTGAASVIAAIKAAAELKLEGIAVNAYVAATQNLTGESAFLPDSIIDSSSGKKIEIRHTDAEGRLTLADAVHKATLDKPDSLITIATLTGSAAVAVGHCIALMGTDDALLDSIDASGRSVGETVQKLEILEADYDDIKSDRDAADLSNTGKGRNRGHLTAGAFVLTFAGKIPAAHLDIAGGDAKDGNATGIAVKGLIEFLRQEALRA